LLNHRLLELNGCVSKQVTKPAVANSSEDSEEVIEMQNMTDEMRNCKWLCSLLIYFAHIFINIIYIICAIDNEDNLTV